VQLLNKMEQLQSEVAGVKGLLADLTRGMHASLADTS
jgi:hypothetical protein